MTAEKMMELADEIETRRGKDLYMMQPDRDLVVAALRASAVGAGAREAVKAAFNAGFWAWCGPTNERELDRDMKLLDEAWTEYSAALPARPEAPAGVREAAQHVLDTFKKDEAQGYHSRDRRFAIDILEKALSLPSDPVRRTNQQGGDPTL